MFWFFVFIVIGIVTGLGLSKARTPVLSRVKVALVFGAATVVILLVLFNSTAMGNFALVYAIAAVLTEVAWTAHTWRRLFPDAGLSFFDALFDELGGPQRLRAAYADRMAERDGGAAGSAAAAEDGTSSPAQRRKFPF